MKKAFLIILSAVATAAMARIVTVKPADGAKFELGEGGRIAAVQAFSPSVAAGSIALKQVWSGDVYTNDFSESWATSIVYAVEYSNTVSAAIFTNRVSTLPVPVEIYCNILGIVTNSVVTATTNRWSAYSHTYAVTNTIISGTASGNVFSAAPASTNYVAPSDKLILEGTAASNGWLRIICE